MTQKMANLNLIMSPSMIKPEDSNLDLIPLRENFFRSSA